MRPTLLTLLLLSPSYAAAAELRTMPAPSLWIEAYGGGHFFLQKHEPFGHGPVFGAKVGVNLLPHFGLELASGLIPTQYLIEDWRGPAGRSTIMANPRLDFTFHLMGPGPVLPYLQAGVGFKYFKIGDEVPASFEGADLPDTARPSVKWHDLDFQWDAAVGVKLFLLEQLGIDINFRYLMSGEQVESFRHIDGSYAYADRFDNLELTLGIFGVIGGKPKDTDKDGLADKVDACVNEPEDKDNFEDGNGCPEPDNDKDGLLDAADKCPIDPEDLDGFEGEDGCPDPDNDKDGLLDAADKCPIDAEDKDAFEDEDGCPELDNDKDGIADATDKCPLEPETKNKYKDDDGCPEPDRDKDGIPDEIDKSPDAAETFNGYQDGDGTPDEIPKAIKKFTGVIQGINFELNSDKLTKGSTPILDKALVVLLEFTDIKLEVQGHTSADGDDAANLDLSARRAASVVRYFVEKGVDPSRLIAKGYGETMPIAPDDANGRKKNRRVEFKLVIEGGLDLGSLPAPAPAPAPEQKPEPAQKPQP